MRDKQKLMDTVISSREESAYHSIDLLCYGTVASELYLVADRDDRFSFTACGVERFIYLIITIERELS
jgi:hypothetical protein